MRSAAYNLGIPNLSANPLCRVLPLAHILRAVALLSFLLPSVAARAADWNEPEQQLARKIVAVTGPGAVALTVENRSSLSKRDNEIIQNGLRAALEGVGLRFVTLEQAAATVAIFLSENSVSYVWVAQIHQGTGEAVVVMVSAPRAARFEHSTRVCTAQPCARYRCGHRMIRFSTWRFWKRMAHRRTSRCSMPRRWRSIGGRREMAAWSRRWHRSCATMASGFARPSDSRAEIICWMFIFPA